MCKDSDRPGMIIEEKDTEFARQDVEGTQEVLRLSRKRIKKLNWRKRENSRTSSLSTGFNGQPTEPGRHNVSSLHSTWYMI
jgi:hypothetical protein